MRYKQENHRPRNRTVVFVFGLPHQLDARGGAQGGCDSCEYGNHELQDFLDKFFLHGSRCVLGLVLEGRIPMDVVNRCALGDGHHHEVKSSPPSSSVGASLSSLVYFTATFWKVRPLSAPAKALPGRKLMRAFLMRVSE